jgi:deazaflavin-dependent oxidoreductase (nitroreductase family)
MASDEYCYVTTTGRRSGRPHRIEIWYAAHDDTLYLLAGGGAASDWVRNLMADAAVEVELGDATRHGTARIIEGGEEAERARTLVFTKYQLRYDGDLTSWRRRALPVAINLAG